MPPNRPAETKMIVIPYIASKYNGSKAKNIKLTIINGIAQQRIIAEPQSQGTNIGGCRDQSNPLAMFAAIAGGPVKSNK